MFLFSDDSSDSASTHTPQNPEKRVTIEEPPPKTATMITILPESNVFSDKFHVNSREDRSFNLNVVNEKKLVGRWNFFFKCYINLYIKCTSAK